MTSWTDITIDELRAELDAYAGDEGYGPEDGWLSLNELAEELHVNRHTVSALLRQFIANGRVEQAQRRTRRIDGVRCWKRVYRLVDAE